MLTSEPIHVVFLSSIYNCWFSNLCFSIYSLTLKRLRQTNNLLNSIHQQQTTSNATNNNSMTIDSRQPDNRWLYVAKSGNKTNQSGWFYLGTNVPKCCHQLLCNLRVYCNKLAMDSILVHFVNPKHAETTELFALKKI